jgi:hypothetical protein
MQILDQLLSYFPSLLHERNSYGESLSDVAKKHRRPYANDILLNHSDVNVTRFSDAIDVNHKKTNSGLKKLHTNPTRPSGE